MSQVILTFVAKNRFCVLNDCRKESNKEWYLEKCRNYQLGISPIKLFETQALLCLWPAFTVVDTNVHDCDTAAWGGPQRIRNSFQFVSRCMFLSPEGRSAGEPGGEKGGECRHCVSTQAQCRLRRRKCEGSSWSSGHSRSVWQTPACEVFLWSSSQRTLGRKVRRELGSLIFFNCSRIWNSDFS